MSSPPFASENRSYSDGSPDYESYQMQDSANGDTGPLVSHSGKDRDDQSPPFFRSEDMTLAQLFLQFEAAYTCVSELGELGLVQFRDLNPDTNVFQRKFVNEVRRCDEMERKLRFLDKEIRKDQLRMPEPVACPEAPAAREMADMEATFEKLEQELKGVNQNAEQLKKNFLELTELKLILRKTESFFREHDGDYTDLHAMSVAQNQQLIPTDSEFSNAAGPVNLGFLAGVIHMEKIPGFERMLWRACRGNVFLRRVDIDEALEDLSTGNVVRKSVFIIFFQGDQLKSRVKKICEGFRATLYPCPDTGPERREMSVGVMQRLEDLKTVIGQTTEHRHRLLLASAKNVKTWFIKVRKIKAIYHTLNSFSLDVTTKCLIAECWIPTADIGTIQLALRHGTERSGSAVAPIFNRMVTQETPPTFFRTNTYTSAFQELINAYGVATYREINPAVFTVITFPFLFSVMFGDLGHGLIMMVFALWMCLREKQLQAAKINNEIWKIFFSGRYLIALMSVFSVYAGFLYNDAFSKSFNVFGSSWQVDKSVTDIMKREDLMLDPDDKKRFYYGQPYPVGLDPIWQVAENKIVFLNSFKMKLSIILGVIHMLFGISLSYRNNKYFNKPINIYTEFIPQVIFLVSLFGYLALLMFHKWVTYYATSDEENVASSEYCAPSILITFINMMLLKPNDPVNGNKLCPAYMYGGQRWLQYLFVFVALCCVPVMLLGKPWYLRKRHLAKRRNPTSDNEFDFSETLILQAIHTIEFVLGTVSHTASYLRLWALSLAHAQLSEVLWNMVLRIGLRIDDW